MSRWCRAVKVLRNWNFTQAERRWLATPPALRQQTPHLNGGEGLAFPPPVKRARNLQTPLMDEGEAGASVATLLQNAESVLRISEVSTPDAIRSICRKKVPGWHSVPDDAIIVKQLGEGLSNLNFKVQIPPSAATTSCALFRVYGTNREMLFDQDLELRIFKVLSAFQIAPRMYSSGNGWRIEEWHFSEPLPNRSMRNPSIFAQVAAHLGRLHKLSTRADFPQDILGQPALSSQRFEQWGAACKRTLSSFSHPAPVKLAADFNIDEMLAERKWLAEFCTADNPKIKGSGLDVVFSHWDAQENNILQTQYGLRFIDFEYAGMEHQAFDIASYFVECTIDYLVDDFPFYKVSLTDFPSEWEQRLFCSIYLSEYLETTILPDSLPVSVLLERVQRFTLVSHLLWSFWSVIRASQMPTSGGFDYLQYAQTRWFMYKRAKQDLLQKPLNTIDP